MAAAQAFAPELDAFFERISADRDTSTADNRTRDLPPPTCHVEIILVNTRLSTGLYETHVPTDIMRNIYRTAMGQVPIPTVSHRRCKRYLIRDMVYDNTDNKDIRVYKNVLCDSEDLTSTCSTDNSKPKSSNSRKLHSRTLRAVALALTRKKIPLCAFPCTASPHDVTYVKHSEVVLHPSVSLCFERSSPVVSSDTFDNNEGGDEESRHPRHPCFHRVYLRIKTKDIRRPSSSVDAVRRILQGVCATHAANDGSDAEADGVHVQEALETESTKGRRRKTIQRC